MEGHYVADPSAELDMAYSTSIKSGLVLFAGLFARTLVTPTQKKKYTKSRKSEKTFAVDNERKSLESYADEKAVSEPGKIVVHLVRAGQVCRSDS